MIAERRGRSRDQAWLCIAIVRVATVAVVAASTELIRLPFGTTLTHPELEITLVLAGIWALGLAGLRGKLAGPLSRLLLVGVVDMVFICALTAESGGPVSQAKKAFFLFPVAAAMTRRPKATAAWTAAAMVAYTAITVGHRAAEGPAGAAGVYSYAAFIGLVGLAAALLSLILAQERDHILELAQHRRQLLAWNLSADEDARQRLAYQLHDGPVQNLLAAVRLEARVMRGDTDSLHASTQVLKDTISELRAAIFALHPHTLADSGLVGALRLIGQDAVERAQLRVELDLDERAAGVHDELIFACAREMVTNVIRHANAQTLTVILTRASDQITLQVTDDGAGLAEIPAFRPGHLGLSTMAERVSAADGRLTLLAPPRGGGTAILLTFPAGPLADDHAPEPHQRGQENSVSVTAAEWSVN